MTMTRVGRRIEIRGVIQGVGVRPWIYRLSDRGRTGWFRAKRLGGRHD